MASTQSAEVKKGNTRPDLGLIFSAVPAVAAGVFTRNLVKAAPIQINLKRIVKQTGRAILVNSGNANACTGPAGLKDAQRLSRQISQALAIPDSQVFLASTGVIGKRLPMTRMTTAVPSLIQSLSPHGLPKVSEAIMTTDTFPKLISEEIVIGKKKVHLVGMAKGAGMMHPNMATMLCFVLTDLAVSPALLYHFLKKATDQSFHRITVDGDTSTNDMVLVLANGLAGNGDLNREDHEAFQRGLTSVMDDLATMIVKDGEGATKVVRILVKGAASGPDAETAARTIANSSLDKTAFYGQDPNWGRIMAALGRSEIRMKEEDVSIFINDIQIVEGGLGKGADAEKAAAELMKQDGFDLTVDLRQGKHEDRMVT
ncbi:MAG: bifunctional glutamate N-acetyltransferase/amino-acid acetyltransferase ArgJ, partial [Deltaproteobacteria bacterium]|nr:bifunctional glutamate N-acetyltransferase/amino-acid acetyltransferase ArgJ [Deltaproteobacteria bacterium]